MAQTGERQKRNVKQTKKALRNSSFRFRRESAEWYTPLPYLAAVREVLGTIELDPASCTEANDTVQAVRFLVISMRSEQVLGRRRHGVTRDHSYTFFACVLNWSTLNRHHSHSIMSNRGHSGSLTVRIYNYRALEFASSTVFQAVNGCAAHHSRKLLILRPKTCSLFAFITKSMFLISAQAPCRARRTLEKSLTVVFGSVHTQGPIMAYAYCNHPLTALLLTL